MNPPKTNKQIYISIIILFTGILFFPHFSNAREILATDLSPASIRAAVSAASPGDTVVLPAGDVGSDGSWNVQEGTSFTAVNVKAGVSLRGQGVDKTIIRQIPGDGQSYSFFYFNLGRSSTTYTTEISGFKLIGAGTSGPNSTGYGLRVRSLPVIKIHDIWIEDKSSVLLSVDDCDKGVIYNSTFRYAILETSYGSGGYGIGFKGSYPYTWPSTYPQQGTDNVIFVEDNTFYGLKHAIEGGDNARYVIRHNNFSGGWWLHAQIDMHGARDYENEDSSGLSVEVYDNDITLSSCDRSLLVHNNAVKGVSIRGGYGVVFNNRFHSSPGSSSTDSIIASLLDINAHLSPVYSYPADYPIIWQPRNIYAWGNTYDSNPVNMRGDSTQWFVEDRMSTNSMGTFPDYHNGSKPGYTPYAYPHPLRSTVPPDVDTVQPVVSSFDVQPRTTTDSITATYVVTDNQSLARVELWRTTDDGGMPNTIDWTQITNRIVSGTSYAGDFTDSPLVGTYWYGLHVLDAAGNIGIEASPIKITKMLPETVFVSLSADPSSGAAPLNGVDLTAVVSGTATGTINYIFYCNRADSGINITKHYSVKYDDATETTKTAADLCNYTKRGTFYAKVIIERGALRVEARTNITVTRTSTKKIFLLSFFKTLFRSLD